LPSSPVAGNQVMIGADNFVNTTIARNGANIMNLAENLTLNCAYTTIHLYYVDATRGWRII
jgi:hypothetical protein